MRFWPKRKQELQQPVQTKPQDVSSIAPTQAEVITQTEGRDILPFEFEITFVKQYLDRHMPGSHAVATDTFLKKSSKQYGKHWLTRELVQNKVDANKAYPGSLDGMEIKEEPTANGGVRFTFAGSWEFADPKGIIALHSEKAEGQENAGGNGIGLKQVAIRLIRDFGVTDFSIYGEGWKTSFALVGRDAINKALRSDMAAQRTTPIQDVKNDWLVASVTRSPQKGKAVYVVETANKELIGALREFKNVGVSKENPYLKDPDYVSKYGSIKWHAAKGGSGRLYMNGQVFNYAREGTEAEKGWAPMPHLSLQLNNVDYKRTIDRPPVNSWDLTNYMSKLVDSMTAADLRTQLKKSYDIWTSVPVAKAQSYGEMSAVKQLIGAIISRLVRAGYNSAALAKEFPGKKFATIGDMNTKQIATLEKEGYTIVMSEFEQLGVVSGDTIINAAQQSEHARPDASAIAKSLETVASKVGFEVFGPAQDVPDAATLGKILKLVLGPQCAQAMWDANKGILTIPLPKSISASLLTHPLSTPASHSDEQKTLYALRGAIRGGLTSKVLGDAVIRSDNKLATFGLADDPVLHTTKRLFSKVVDSKGGGAFVSFYLSQHNYTAIAEIFAGISGAKPTAAPFGGAAPLLPGTDVEVPGAAFVPGAEKRPTGASVDASNLFGAKGPDGNTILPGQQGANAPQGGRREGGSIYRVGADGEAVDGGDDTNKGEFDRGEYEGDDDSDSGASDAIQPPGMQRRRKKGHPDSVGTGGGFEEGDRKRTGVRRSHEVWESDEEGNPQAVVAYGPGAGMPKRPNALGDAGLKTPDRSNDPEDTGIGKMPGPHPEFTNHGGKVFVGIKEREFASNLTPKQVDEFKRLADDLDKSLSALKPKVSDEANPVIKKYMDWREKNRDLSQATIDSGYLTGKHLSEILVDANPASKNIPHSKWQTNPEDNVQEQILKRLKDIIAQYQPSDNTPNDFEMIWKPTPAQMARLGMLRDFLHLTTGARFGNDLFVFKASNTSGLNLAQRAIGLHEAVLDSTFENAISVMTHELAHNEYMDHDVGFMTTMEALFARGQTVLYEIIGKQSQGQTLSVREKAIIELPKLWTATPITPRATLPRK